MLVAILVPILRLVTAVCALVGLIAALVGYSRTCKARDKQQNVMPPKAQVIVVSAPAVVPPPNSSNVIIIHQPAPVVEMPNPYATNNGLVETNEPDTESDLQHYAIDYSEEQRPPTTNGPEEGYYPPIQVQGQPPAAPPLASEYVF